jgi:ethanolamine utilization microcompartment shell protein EutS
MMSVHAVHKICRQVLRDHDFRKRMQLEPAAAIADCDLTPEERRALLAGDVATLHRMGVNDFMMGYLARFGSCGLSVAIFNEKIRSVPH